MMDYLDSTKKRIANKNSQISKLRAKYQRTHDVDLLDKIDNLKFEIKDLQDSISKEKNPWHLLEQTKKTPDIMPGVFLMPIKEND